MKIAPWLAALAACTSPPRARPAVSHHTTAASAVPAAPSGAPGAPLPWADLNAATLARAKAEHKFVVLDGSAAWCHWCHVMEAETYHDPAVRQILDRSFIAVKVDIDARPDIAERYGDWGWPATVIFSPDATELGKYRGYIEPARFAEILNDVVAGEAAAAAPTATLPPAPRTALSEDTLAWIEHAIDVNLASWWDPEQGGWGMRQKAPIGWNNAWLLDKARAGDAAARKDVLFSLDQQAQLIDPVWGGMSQYSAGRDWSQPHYEKLMSIEAPALENYAEAYALTGDPKQLARAHAIAGYLERFLRAPDGAFHPTQDADLNAHDPARPYMDGHHYYALSEHARLAAGIPRVDPHEYADATGLAIAAYCTLYQATHDPAALAVAEQAARAILATHARPDGTITHDVSNPATPGKAPLVYLADNAAFGRGLVRLYEVTHDGAYIAAAERIADALIAHLTDDATGGLYASTPDPDAVGVFATRRVPFEDNVMALRFFGHLAHAMPADDARRGIEVAIDRMLRVATAPELTQAQGRFLGEVLLALDATRGVRGIAR